MEQSVGIYKRDKTPYLVAWASLKYLDYNLILLEAYPYYIGRKSATKAWKLTQKEMGALKDIVDMDRVSSLLFRGVLDTC
jgi:hypothetical protein